MFEQIESSKYFRFQEEHFLVCKRYFDLYLMMGTISIDGFKRERYILKVKDLTDEISTTLILLNQEEARLEGGLKT